MRIRDIMAKAGESRGLDVMSIVSFALSMRKEQIFTRLDMEVGDERARYIESLITDRGRGKPLAYITGEKEFFSHSFKVDGRVLIPRPETELLVEEALAILDGNQDLQSIVDVGTGSGIIGNTIARIASRRVLCIDISPEALLVAEENGRTSGLLDDRLSFIASDLFSAVKKGISFDMIVTNLPYVAETEWDEVMADVKEYEPEKALLGGPDGLDIYRKLIQSVPERVKPGGYILAEIGGAVQAEKMVHLLEKVGMRASVKKDLAHRERVVIGSWKNS